ncbi:MAG: GNAT family N-acetyltransferase [Nannocystaceae bacterium]|nr:GNAT family N-acetyltransferase [Nannocystaceae bacterium]
MTAPHRVEIMHRELTDADREAIAHWRYSGDLALYSPGSNAHLLRTPDHVALRAPADPLIGYGTAGADARVPGGLYEGHQVVDVGLGLRPDLVGAGLGADALRTVIAWVRETTECSHVRATVAAENPRATALVLRAGFSESYRFTRPRDGRAFVQYLRSED